MAKIKFGLVGDAACPTGFGTVSHGIMRYLQSTGEFECQAIGINYDGRPNEWSSEFKVWPAHLGGDLLGAGLVPQFFNEYKPDVFLMFQDFWNIPLYVGQCPPNTTGLVTYYPVDAPCVKGQFMLPQASVAETIVYTKFGAEESARAAVEAWAELVRMATAQKQDIVDRFVINVSPPPDPYGRSNQSQRQVLVSAHRLKELTNVNNYKVIPHGIDTSAFFKMPSKAAARKMLGLSPKGFYVGNVNRNQSRKRLDLTIRGFSGFAKAHPDAVLVLHSVKNDGQGWDLKQLASYYGVSDKVIYTNELVENQTATIEQLNYIYNSFDVQINTGGGEGFGYTAFEGAAAGVPQVVPDWSATKELWQNSGLLLKVVSVRHEPAMINTMQAVIDTDHLVTTLNELYENPTLKESVGEKCFAVTQQPEYKWENVGKQFAEVFKNAIGKVAPYAPVPLSIKGHQDLKQLIKNGQAIVRNTPPETK